MYEYYIMFFSDIFKEFAKKSEIRFDELDKAVLPRASTIFHIVVIKKHDEKEARRAPTENVSRVRRRRRRRRRRGLVLVKSRI